MCTDFTRKYGVTRLIWFEAHVNIGAAYKREQLIKRWRREWKLALIEKLNPRWEDLISSIAASARRLRTHSASSAVRSVHCGFLVS